MTSKSYECERCDRELDPDKTVWLELRWDTGLYYAPGTEIPEDKSQGGFPFGAACAKRVLANGGELEEAK
jgi:hypothetical protein